MKEIKDKIVNFFKKDVKYYSINFWNIITHFLKEKKFLSIIALTIIAIIIVAAVAMCTIKSNFIDNKSRDLASMGFTAKCKNYIYYMGYDDGSTDGIYRIKVNGKNAEKINSDYALYLNSDGKYIYYLDYENEDIVKIKPNGNDKQTLVESVDLTTITLYNNYIYYIKNSNFYRIKTNGKNNSEKLLSKSIYSYEICDDWVYYTYYNDGEYMLAKITTEGKNKTILEETAGVNFFTKGNYIYYVHEDYSTENGVYEYELYRIKNNGKDKKLITTLVDIDSNTINTDGKNIYYTKTDSEGNYGIYKIKMNGKDETKIVDVNGYKTYMNIIGEYIYYPDNNEKENTSLFRIKTSGKEKQEII